jgi:hypothetical protein
MKAAGWRQPRTALRRDPWRRRHAAIGGSGSQALIRERRPSFSRRRNFIVLIGFNQTETPVTESRAQIGGIRVTNPMVM